MDIKKFGQRLKLEESKTSKVKKEKEIFIEMITLLEHCLKRSDMLFNDFSIDMYEYEEYFIKVIENLLLIKYGEVVSEIVFWYLYDRISEDGKIYPLIYEEENKEPVNIIMKTPSDLWKFIDKILKTTNNE
jgi:hypothetical protein